MTRGNFRFWFGVVLVAIGIVVAVVFRVKSIDLTEGRALITYWYAWLASMIVMLSGLWCVTGRRIETKW